MESTDIKYEYLRKEHCNGLSHLYKNVFGKKVDKNYFVIKYGLEFRTIHYSAVAIHNNVVIGFHGAIYATYYNDSQERRMNLLHTCDFILLPEYRGRGIFQEMYNHTIELAREKDVDYLYAFHSDQTYKVCKRLGWNDEMGFSRFHIKQLNFSTTRLFKLLGLSGFRKRKFKNLCKEHHSSKLDFSTSQIFQGYCRHYDEEFIGMKSFAEKEFININGCKIWLKYDHYLTVGFIGADDQLCIEPMLNFIKSLLKKCWIHEAVFHIHNGSPLISQFGQHLKKEPSFKISSLQLNKNVDSFSNVQLHFMDMDIF